LPLSCETVYGDVLGRLAAFRAISRNRKLSSIGFHSVHLAEYTRTMTRVIFVLWIVFAAQAQTQAPAAPTLEKLLVEVHQLRLALERSTQIAPRIQIAVERLKLQQEKVARTAQQLDELRREVDRGRLEQPKIQQRLQAIENETNQAADPAQRRHLEEAMKDFKLEAEQREKSLQQMQAREGELTGQLQTEQNRLTELNDRLDQIERALNVP
jgi:DNA repair exonuclease SbcCD ATPase subunit